MVGRQNADIVDTLHLRDVAIATMFWLSIYGVHIGATWRVRLNLHVQCGLMSNYFDHLFFVAFFTFLTFSVLFERFYIYVAGIVKRV